MSDKLKAKLTYGFRSGRPRNAVICLADDPYMEVCQFFHDPKDPEWAYALCKDMVEAYNASLTRPVPDSEPQEGLRVALEGLDRWDPVCNYAMDAGMEQSADGTFIRLDDALAALASPKADQKTDGELTLSDEEVQGIADTLRRTFSGADANIAFLRMIEVLCAQAKRCNALERERERLGEVGREFEANWKHSEKKRDAAEAERDALAKQVGEMRAVIAEASSDIDGRIQILRTANKVVIADWAHGPFKELDVYIGGSCYILEGVCKRLDQALAKSQPAEKEVCQLCDGMDSFTDCTCKPADGKE